jgi:hypothetical protein
MTRIADCPKIYRDLKEHVDKLALLLGEPEPGLWSWCNFVALEVKEIVNLYEQPFERIDQ